VFYRIQPAARKAGRSIYPPPEHYLSFLYALALQGKDEEVSLPNDQATAAGRGGDVCVTSKGFEILPTF
jgi:hypothetical protein